jgi:hypothetical protein
MRLMTHGRAATRARGRGLWSRLAGIERRAGGSGLGSTAGKVVFGGSTCGAPAPPVPRGSPPAEAVRSWGVEPPFPSPGTAQRPSVLAGSRQWGRTGWHGRSPRRWKRAGSPRASSSSPNVGACVHRAVGLAGLLASRESQPTVALGGLTPSHQGQPPRSSWRPGGRPRSSGLLQQDHRSIADADRPIR